MSDNTAYVNRQVYMPRFDPNNHLVIGGNLSRDPKVFANRDGSYTVRYTVAKDGRRKDPQNPGNYLSEFIPLEQYVPAGQNPGIIASLFQGSEVIMHAHLEDEKYESNGETVYALKAKVDYIDARDTKARSEELRAKSQARNAGQAAPAAPAAPAPQLLNDNGEPVLSDQPPF